MRNVRGTPAYWQKQLYDVLAMMRTFGTPTWFLTLSPAEFMWPEFIQAIGKKIGRDYTEEDIQGMEWITKAELMRKNPVPISAMFQNRVESFFNDFLRSKAEPLGKIKEYVQKIEFQARGSPHAHCLLWIEDAPVVGCDSDEEVCSFVDQYISGRIPTDTEENQEMRELVKKLQTHRHSGFCRPHTNANCRFNFPRPPTTQTIIGRHKKSEDKDSIDEKERRKIMELVQERMKKDEGCSLEEILDGENIPEEVYLECLRRTCKRGSSIILKRDVGDVNTNNHNLDCLSVWKANMDLQYVADPYSCIMYVLSYVMKSENGMSELLKRVAKEYKDEIKQQMRKILLTFRNKREVSAQEAVKRVLSEWLFRKSRAVVHISNGPEQERHRCPKPQHVLITMDDENEDVFMTNIHDRYAARPDDLEEMCLAIFGTRYVPCPDKKKGNRVITLKNDLGKMTERLHDAVLRTAKFSDDTYKFYYSKLLLFWPWRNETEIGEGYGSCEEHYNEVKDIVEMNARPFNMDRKDIDNALDEYMKNPKELSDWLEAKPTEEDIIDKLLEEDSDGEGREVEERSSEDKNRRESSLSLKYKAEALKDTVSNEEYCQMMRGLNKEQRQIVMFNRRHIKDTIVKRRKGEETQGYQVFLSGSGGTGKSHVIKLIYRDNVKLFRRSNASTSDDLSGFNASCHDVIALLTAYTGTAAFNIEGTTLHSAFQLQENRVSDEKKTTMRTRLHRLEHVTIDEVSMVGRTHLDLVNDRCSMIKHQDPNRYNFGRVSILAVGDFYQLAPVCESYVFQPLKNPKLSKHMANMESFLWSNFYFHELTQVMRQRDTEFADLLNSVRVKKPEENSEEDKKLKAREIHLSEDHPDYPKDVLHVYAENIPARARNERKLNTIDRELFVSKAEDSIEDLNVDMSDIKKEDRLSKTNGLPNTLLVKVGARVLLTNNIDVADGLTNGVFGYVTGIISTQHASENGEATKEVRAILVRFDSERIGKEAKAKSLYKRHDPFAVPIFKVEGKCKMKRRSNEKMTVRVTRKQFPLILAWAVTIHKVQGMTVDEIVVDMTRGKGRYFPGQAYVALSRVRTYEKLHIVNYNRHQIRVCAKVKNEMDRLREEMKVPEVDKACVEEIDDSHMKICHINVAGLTSKNRSKKQDLLADSDVQKVDILCITETHCKNEGDLVVSDIWKEKTGIVYRKDRTERNGGGVAIMISNKYKSRQIEFETTLEIVAAEIFCPRRVVVVCLYIPPDKNKLQCAEQLCGLLRHPISSENDIFVILGDINEDIMVAGENGSNIAKAMLQEGFTQHIHKATTDYGSLLDHVYTRGISAVEVDVQDAYYSDHDKVFCFFPEKEN